MAISGSLNFLTIGETGSANIGVDFVGLNTVIAEPFTASTNTLGLPDTPGAAAYYNSEVDSPAPFNEVPTHLNSILLHRNGPYQHPSWKQYRGGEHPVARSMRLNNTMSIDTTFADPIRREASKRNTRDRLENMILQDQEDFYNKVNSFIGAPGPGQVNWPMIHRSASLARYYEPSVLKAHKPFLYTVNNNNETFKVRSTLMNQMVFFENKDLNESLNIAGPDRLKGFESGKVKKPKQQYYELLHAAKETGGSNFIYKQTIFPKSINVFRPYKLEKPDYEEEGGYDSNGLDREVNRSFWRNSQPEGLREYSEMVSDISAGNTRTRGAPRNSQGMKQIARPLTGRPNQNFEGSYTLFTTASDDNKHDLGSWNFTYRFIENGVLAYGGIMTVTKSVDIGTYTPGMPTQPPLGAFNTLETYNPHLISLISMWPLDPRSDIYSSPGYLTSSIAGRGLQIGATPNRAKEYVGTTNLEVFNPVFTASLSASGGTYRSSYFLGGSGATHNVADGTYAVTASATASYSQVGSGVQVTTAGELVYSTKPTMFFHITGSVTGSGVPNRHDVTNYPENGLPLIGDVKGYIHQTASMQYNRHTFPYNTPFYATHKIRGREPFYDTYTDFSEDMKYLGRDYSIVPEYNIANSVEYYYETFFKTTLDKELHIEKDIGPENFDPVNPDNSFYSIPATNKPRIIKRNLKIYQSKPLYSLHKLNFLTLHGAFVTSSGATQDFSNNVPSTDAFSYDTLDKTTESSTIESVVGYSKSKSALHYAQDSTAVIFKEAFSHTDNTGEFANLLLDPMAQGENTIPTRIKFTVHALKKLRPEKNFYPVLKTLDLGNKFKDFIYENLNTNIKPLAVFGNTLSTAENWRRRPGLLHAQHDFTAQKDHSPGQLQSFLEPFFAPGILYNSIKSGIAVDYPVYTKKPAYLAPFTFFSGSVLYHSAADSQSTIEKNPSKYGKPHTNNRLTNFVTGVINYGSFYMLGASRCIPSILTTVPDYRMPFEALYKTNIIADKFNVINGNVLWLTTDFLDLDINAPDIYATTASAQSHKGAASEHPGAAHTYTGPRGQLKQTAPDNTNRALYESSINNFLCETMNFFLKDQGLEGVKLPVLVSKAKSNTEFSLNADKLYSMAVTLKMGKDQIMCEGPRDAGQGGSQARGTDPGYVADYHDYAAPRHRMRGYIYGPPIEVVRMSGTVSTSTTERIDSNGNIKILEPLIESDAAAGNQIGQGKYGAYFGANLQDPAYQAFTPPYFYGHSSLILAAQDIDASINSWTSMFEKTEKDSYYLENYVTGTGLEDLCLTVPGTGSTSGFYSTRMKIDSSLDIYKKATVNVIDGDVSSTLKNIWYISPKWISPVLDFSSSFASVTTLAKQGILQEYELSSSYVENTYHDTTTGRGLWGGYGTDPYDPIAMKTINDLSNVITDVGESTTSTKKNIEKGIILELRDPRNNFQYSSSLASYKTDDTTFQGDLSSYYTKKVTNQNTNKTGSLGLELGFLKSAADVKKVNIGEIADEKKVSEALLIVPYFEKPVHLPADSFFPAGELFRTREIIPGKHFLPINNMLFENLLSMVLSTREKPLTELLPKSDAALTSVEVAALENPNDALQNPGITTTRLIGFESEAAYKAAAATDVYKMIETIMGDEKNGVPGYELPPEFDFVNYNWVGNSKLSPAVPGPFQMIIVPVDHTLQKQELIDIYQGVMPESSLSFEKQIQSKTFDLSPNQSHSWMPKTKSQEGFFGGTPGVNLSGMNPANFLDCSYLYQENLKAHVKNKFLNQQWIKTSRDFYKNLKFMTFKIKQKAQKDYDNYKNRQIAKVVENKLTTELSENQRLEDFDFGFTTEKRVSDVFGYNWPYDDFSIVEAVKIDIEFEVEE